MLNKIINEFNDWFEAFLRNIPGKIGVILRMKFYKHLFKCNVIFESGCVIVAHENISLSNGVGFGRNSYLSASGGKIIIGVNTAFNMNCHINASVGGEIKIGDYCLIGPNVVFRTAGHNYEKSDLHIYEQGHVVKNITIDQDVWLGANCIILGGVEIGKGAIIGAGAVVTKNIPPMSVAAGVPAKVIKFRK